jgi:hypothetical protein
MWWHPAPRLRFGTYTLHSEYGYRNNVRRFLAHPVRPPRQGAVGNGAQRGGDKPTMWPGETNAELGAEPSITGERDPVAVFRTDGIVEGTIPKLDGRMTESLAEAAHLHIRTSSSDGASSQRVVLDLDEIVAIAAPPRPPSPYRVARRQHVVEIRAGPYRVSGVAHLPLGADPERYVASAPRRWLPLTHCTVGTGVDEWAVETVIVNLDYASRERATYEAPRFG